MLAGASRRGHRAAFLRGLERGQTLLDCGDRDLPRIRQLMARYADLPLRFGDAAVVACAERNGGVILSFDRAATGDRLPRRAGRLGPDRPEPRAPAGTLGSSMGAESPKEECGLFGVWAPGEDVARLTYFGLFAQQHRGQESAGIAVSDRTNILVYKDMGLVSQVFNEATLTTLHGDLAIGHTRYSTTGSTTWENAQPVFKTDGVHSLALGHNGNLVNTAELAALVGSKGGATTDSDIVTTLIANDMPASGALEEAAMRVLPMLRGAFCFIFMDERSVYAARDPHGVRPFSIGRLPNGFVVASETCALDIVGADARPRGRAGRAGPDRRPRSAQHAVRRVAEAVALRVRGRLPRPAGLAHARPVACTRRAARWAGASRRSIRPTPTW